MKHLRVVTNAEESELVFNHFNNDNYSMIIHFNDPDHQNVPSIVTKFVKKGEVDVHYKKWRVGAEGWDDMIYDARLDEPITNILDNIANLSGNSSYGSYGYLYQERDQEFFSSLSGTTIGSSPEYDSRYDVFANYAVN